MGRLKEVRYLTSGEAAFDEDGLQKGADDAGSVESGCWADVWDDESGEYRTCECEPPVGSALGLCVRHESLLATAPKKAHEDVARSPSRNTY